MYDLIEKIYLKDVFVSKSRMMKRSLRRSLVLSVTSQILSTVWRKAQIPAAD